MKNSLLLVLTILILGSFSFVNAESIFYTQPIATDTATNPGNIYFTATSSIFYNQTSTMTLSSVINSGSGTSGIYIDYRNNLFTFTDLDCTQNQVTYNLGNAHPYFTNYFLIPLNGGVDQNYDFDISAINGHLVGVKCIQLAMQVNSNGGTLIGTHYYGYITTGGTIPFNGSFTISSLGTGIPFTGNYVPIATTSALFNSNTYNATDTLNALNNGCTEIDNLFGKAICTSFSFLFLPDPTILNTFTSIPETVSTKFPFSWLTQTQTIYNSLTATTTENVSPVILNLHNLGIGSTTPMGNILPNFTILSKDTIKYYIPANVWLTLQLLMIAAIYIPLGVHIFHVSRKKFHHL